MSQLGDKLRALAVEADGGQALIVPRITLAEDTGQDIPRTADGKQFAEDFWVNGRMGAQKGAWTAHYAWVWQITSMMGGTIPLHGYVLQAGPLESNANELLTSPADIGWIDGSGYYYNSTLSPQDNEAVYVAFGRPSSNNHGVWDTFGRPLGPDGWAAWRAARQAQAAARKG